MLVSAESQVHKLISRGIIIAEFITMHQRHRRTDGQKNYHGNTALRYSSRGKNSHQRRCYEYDLDFVIVLRTLTLISPSSSISVSVTYTTSATHYSGC